MRLVWTEQGWNDYQHWIATNKKILKRVNLLIKDCKRDPYDGIGKPEHLKYMDPGVWSRRITDEHRLVYSVKADDMIILQARHHYQ